MTGFTAANPGVVTTANPNNYLAGLLVRLALPDYQSIYNNQIFTITPLSPTMFSLNADTSNWPVNDFFASSQTPQVIPVAEVAETLLMAEQNARNIIPET